MRWLGWGAGICVAAAAILAVDHLGGSDHVVGTVGSFLLGVGLSLLGWLIGCAAERPSR